MFEGALPQAAEGDYEVRLLPPPVLEGPIPTTSFRVDAPGQRVRTHRDERARADPRGRVNRRQVLHAARSPTALLKDLPKPSKVPLDTDPPIPLWNTWPVLALFLTLLTRGVGFPKTQTNGIILVWFMLAESRGVKHGLNDVEHRFASGVSGAGRPW